MINHLTKNQESRSKESEVPSKRFKKFNQCGHRGVVPGSWIIGG